MNDVDGVGDRPNPNGVVDLRIVDPQADEIEQALTALKQRSLCVYS